MVLQPTIDFRVLQINVLTHIHGMSIKCEKLFVYY